MPLDGVKNILLVLSGKGGVGKSSVTLQLALSLTLRGRSVCILDIDLTGPSMPRLVGKENAKIVQASGGWVPVSVYPASDSDTTTPAPIPSTDNPEGNDNSIARPYGPLRCMSLGFLLRDRGDAVIWRGPKKTAMIRQFLSDVIWGDTDYLLIDTPPGTSDEHIAIAEQLLSQATTSPTSGLTQPRLAGAVLVTTPQAVAISDVRKGVNFCAKTNIPVLGVVENMSGYTCPCCGEVSNVFSKGGGKVMADDMGIRFLGAVPIDVSFGEMVEGPRSDSGENKEEQKAEKLETNGSQPLESPLVERYQKCWSQPTFESLAKEVIQLVETT